MTAIDRRYSVAEGLAYKAPVRAATTSNITLSGLQTIDGIALAENDRVLVWNQTDAKQNGIYAASSGNWTRTKDFDGSYDAGKGTQVFTEDDGATYGGRPFAVSSSGSGSGGYIVFDTDNLNFEAGRDLPPLTANTMLVDNAAGTARENKTFAEVRTLLEIPAFTDLPYILAWDNDVPGDGTDQTTALQAIVDGLPTEGGTIVLKGTVSITELDVSDRRNVRFMGIGGAGTGASQRSMLVTPVGAIGSTSRVIDLRTTINVGFERLYLRAQNSSFNGVLVDYGGASPTPGDDSALMLWDDFTLDLAGAGAGISLYGSTNGTFRHGKISGKGALVRGQTVAGVGFANIHTFHGVTFNPFDQYPVEGSFEALTMIGCNFQAGSDDGIGRAIQTSTSQRAFSLTLLGCTFYDVTTAGGEWVVMSWGEGVSISGCRFGGVTGSYAIALGGTVDDDPQEGGVRGVSICGNSFRGFSAAVNFYGTVMAKSNVRGIVVSGNSVTNGALLSGYSTSEAGTFGPNSIYDAPNEFGANVSYQGLPSYTNRSAAVSGGLTTGQMFIATGGGANNIEVV